jgi:cytochrome c551/c552
MRTAHSFLVAVCLAMYLFGFFLAGPALVVVAIAYAQQADFAVSLGALVALAVVGKATAAAWRQLPR